MAGDVSGGTNTVTLYLDPRYTSIVAWLSWTMTMGTPADVDTIAILADGPGLVDQIAEVVTLTGVVAWSVDAAGVWKPPGHLLEPTPAGQAPRVQCIQANVDGDVQKLSGIVYCFDINARKTGQTLIHNLLRV